MTTYARIVLDDCRAALKDMKSSKAREHTYRSRWVSAIALLRAVGHVLDKRDTEIDKYYRNAIEEAWLGLKKSKPEPRIFWEFIESERNNILKMYQFGAKESITVRPGPLIFRLEAEGYKQVKVQPEETTYEHFLSGGPLDGYSPDEAVSKAIDWWTGYLDKIDQEAKSLKELDT
jgi:hypothetical protein